MAAINDVVIIYLEENPLIFARIEDIMPDHKPGWYHVKLLFLKLPLETVTWILRDTYINGTVFTMNGKRMRLEQVKGQTSKENELAEPEAKDPDEKKGKLIHFRRKSPVSEEKDEDWIS